MVTPAATVLSSLANPRQDIGPGRHMTATTFHARVEFARTAARSTR